MSMTTPADMLESSVDNAATLLHKYIALHNDMAAGIDPHAEDELDMIVSPRVRVDVEGRALSTLRRDAILNTFRDKRLVLWKVCSFGHHVAFANYAWCENPRLGGLLRIRTERGRIVQMTLRPGYSRIFATYGGESAHGLSF